MQPAFGSLVNQLECDFQNLWQGERCSLASLPPLFTSCLTAHRWKMLLVWVFCYFSHTVVSEKNPGQMVLFDLRTRDDYKQARRNHCYTTIQMFQKCAKTRKVGLRYTPNEIVVLDWMDLICAKVFPASSPQIILPNSKRLNISGRLCKSYLFKCIDLAQRAQVCWH